MALICGIVIGMILMTGVNHATDWIMGDTQAAEQGFDPTAQDVNENSKIGDKP